eukprot:scpid61872/ scgid24707/ 
MLMAPILCALLDSRSGSANNSISDSPMRKWSAFGNSLLKCCQITSRLAPMAFSDRTFCRRVVSSCLDKQGDSISEALTQWAISQYSNSTTTSVQYQLDTSRILTLLVDKHYFQDHLAAFLRNETHDVG